MYAFINGRLAVRRPTQVVVEAGGIGYALEISLYTFDQLSGLDRVQLFTHLIVREDVLTLFGFSSEEERSLFRVLIGVNGVGPNMARTVLSSLSPSELRDAISQKDEALIRSIKGVGAKTAQRLVLELQDKVHAHQADTAETPDARASPAENTQTQTREEAITALVLLGFNRAAAEKSVAQVTRKHSRDLSVEALIKHALKSL